MTEQYSNGICIYILEDTSKPSIWLIDFFYHKKKQTI